LLTEAWSEYVGDSLRRIGQEDGPVETKDNDYKEDGNDDFVDWLNGGHTPTDRDASCKDGHTMAQNRPVIGRLRIKILQVHETLLLMDGC
jgi:hypothetical protein